MQPRARYGHTSTPPLHHPVPQHVSSVPQFRSPPPPQASPPGAAGANPYAPAPGSVPPPGGTASSFNMFGGGGGGGAGGYTHFINDPTAQVAAQFGQTALRQGTDYLEQNVLNRWFNFASLKPYFNVTNSYVANKLWLVLFPWQHKPWSRKVGPAMGQHPGIVTYLPPRDDVNSPDMYIPVMAVVTYVLLYTLLSGVRGQFQPEVLGTTASAALVVVVVEILLLNLGGYLLGIANRSQLLDLIAYSGYKFVGLIVTIAVAEVVNGGRGTGGWIGWTLFLYTFFANSLFLMRSLKYVLLPEHAHEGHGGPGGAGVGVGGLDSRARRNQRTQFLFAYSYLVQFVLMWLLSRA